ncbi:MAG: hypothetical protein R2717_04690 [Schumannella sp.]|nr:hypothetical protein [Microbacteriaceae bacterium]
MTDEIPRELAEGDQGDARRPVSARRQRVMRIVVTIALACLVLPGLLSTVVVQVSTADDACRIVVAATAPDSVGWEARFELAGAAGPGWYCYAQRFGGDEIMVRALGIIPGLGSRG